jgi:tetratricopeptide (TPR) repeat protein
LVAFREDGREFYLRYFTKNNVEADILRIIFFTTMKNENISFNQFGKRSIFQYINPNLLKKLKSNGFVYFEGFYDKLTVKGFIASIYIIGTILKQFSEKPYRPRDLSNKLFDEGFSLGGIERDYSTHDKLTRSYLENLAAIGLLNFDGLSYSLTNEEKIIKICCKIVKTLVNKAYIQKRQELNDLTNTLNASFPVEKFSLGSLMKQADTATQEKIKNILGVTTQKEHTLMPMIRKEATRKGASEKDWLASAAYWELEATLHEEKRETELCDYCRARRCISLAIFCKRRGDQKGAAQFYEKAAEAMSKEPQYRKSADLQLANAYECKARYLTKEGNYQESSSYYLKASELFRKLGNKKESVFCRYRNLQNQAFEKKSYGEHLAASELMNEAGALIKPYDEKHYFNCMARSCVFKKNHAHANHDLKGASEACREAAKFYQKAGNQRFHSRTLGNALQFEALQLINAKRSYMAVAKKFKSAATYYGKSLNLELSTICQADSMKYLGLDAKSKGDFQAAINHFNNGKMLWRELAYHCENPQSVRKYKSGELWFEAMLTETTAHKKLLDAISSKQPLGEVAKMLAHSADLFTRIGDTKHAEIDSTFVMVTMAIDAFHRQGFRKASALMRDAKLRLPSDFVFSMFEDKVQPGWHPLRYVVNMIGEFNKYARKIETEKGFSFESRARDLLRKIYSEYANIEPKIFKPESDEIGIVFNDTTPIEIDAVGTQIRENRMRILISEIKNISKPIGKDEMLKFLKKIEFVKKRYTRIMQLQSLPNPSISHRIFMSLSGFEPSAKSIAEKNNIKTLGEEEIRGEMRKHSMYPVP